MFADTPGTIEAAQATAYWRGLDDRRRFVPILKAVEDFVRRKGRVIGGAGATYMLTRVQADGPAKLPLDAFQYLVYTPDPVRDAVELAKHIYKMDPKGLTQYAVALPRGSGSETVVNVEQREVVRFKGLPYHRGVHIYTMLAPDRRDSLFAQPGEANELPCLGPEVQLLETYAALCSPERAGDWPVLLKQEVLLREAFLRSFDGKIQGVIGGRPAAKDGKGYAAVNRLKKSLQEQVGGRAGRLWLVDQHAPRMQCASVYSLADEQATIAKAADDLGRRGEMAGVTVQFLLNDPQLVVDRRLRRLTVYAQVPGRKRDPILDIFNIAHYEAVPYVDRMGTAFVRARFLLVDVWTIQLLWRMKSIADVFAKQQLAALLGRFRALEPALSDPAEAFPALPSHYMGRIESAQLVDRRAAANARETKGPAFNKKKSFHPFYPARFA
jgi:hypothetical protein